MQHSHAAGPTAHPSTSAELLAKRSERFSTSTYEPRGTITTSYSGGLFYSRGSQKLKKDDWEMRKWRIKKEKNGELKSCYYFSLPLCLTSFIDAFSCLEKDFLLLLSTNGLHRHFSLCFITSDLVLTPLTLRTCTCHSLYTVT